MRMALLVTHKRITAKIGGGRSIDADIKPARFIGYCWIPAAHNAEHFILLRVNLTQGNSFFHVGWNFRIRLSSYFFTGFITSLIIAKLATTVIASFTLSQTRSSFPYMVCGSQSSSKQQNQIFSENRSESCREKKPNFAKLRLVYNVQNAWELRPQ